MIDFALEPELELLIETTRGFAEGELRPRERDFERERGVPEALARTFREIGLAGIELPEAHGGAALGALARALVLEELGSVDAGAALALDPLGPALYPVLELGGPALLEALALPLLDRPGARAALVWNERPLVRVDGERATGEVPWIPAERVDLLVLLDACGAAFVTQGIGCERVRGAGLRAAGAVGVRLEGAPVAAQRRDPAGARRALGRARLYLAALLVGVMRASAEYSRAYALQRVAFGRPIAHHQALAFLITDMRTAVDGTRLLVHEAAWRTDRGDDAGEACATALLEAAEQAAFVTPNGVQLLGGHGFMLDYPVEKYMRDARALSLLLGGPDAAREEAGRELSAAEPPLALTLGEG